LDGTEDALPISASERIGLDALLARVDEVLSAELVYITVQVPYARGDLAALFHEQGTVVKTAHEGQGTVIEGYLPRRLLESFRAFWV
jgi:GTP-binding protein HflX